MVIDAGPISIVVPKDGAGVIEAAVYGARVGIDEELGRIESEPTLGKVGPVEAIAIDLARTETGDVAMPQVPGAFRQTYAFGLIRIVWERE